MPWLHPGAFIIAQKVAANISWPGSPTGNAHTKPWQLLAREMKAAFVVYPDKPGDRRSSEAERPYGKTERCILGLLCMAGSATVQAAKNQYVR